MFRFKQFEVDDSHSAMKVGTDGVLLGAWAELPEMGRVLDAGCGTGLLSLMVAQRSLCDVLAVDIDPGAVRDAEANFTASSWTDRLKVCLGSFEEVEGRFDLIICNPPYFINSLKAPDMQRNAARQADSLSPMSILEYAALHLSDGGSVALITPQIDLLYTAEINRLKLRRYCEVSTKAGKAPTRVLWQFSRVDGATETTKLVIGDAQYRHLTENFYLC